MPQTIQDNTIQLPKIEMVLGLFIQFLEKYKMQALPQQQKNNWCEVEF